MKHIPTLICIALLLTACHKDTPVPEPQPQPTGDIYITDSVRYEAEHTTAYRYKPLSRTTFVRDGRHAATKPSISFTTHRTISCR